MFVCFHHLPWELVHAKFAKVRRAVKGAKCDCKPNNTSPSRCGSPAQFEVEMEPMGEEKVDEEIERDLW